MERSARTAAVMARTATVAAIVGTAVWPTRARAQVDWRDQIAQQIADSRVVRTFRGEGYTESHRTFYDLVSAGARKSVTVTLNAGMTYRFVGKCDNDCSDLDFRIYDENDNLIDSDVERDDYPVVTVSPVRTATFRLSVAMIGCSARNCGWGVVVLAAPRRSASSTDWQVQIQRQLDASDMTTMLERRGFSRSHDPQYKLVVSGDASFVTYDLQAGRMYAFIGKCDNDCRDVDLRLYDDDGDLIASDLKADDFPVVTVTPARSARYRLQVSMAACSVRQCGWGVSAYMR